jgi:glycosyltransferase involved in cell wall biosynthesis
VTAVKDSLSVIVPVRNAYEGLATRISQLLDILPDVSSKFEICIVDDGSTDHTDEVANEISQQFPQVQVHRHQETRGILAAVQTGITLSTGSKIFVQSPHEPISAGKIHEQVNANEHASSLASSSKKQEATLLRRLEKWCAEVNRIRAARQAIREAATANSLNSPVDPIDLTQPSEAYRKRVDTWLDIESMRRAHRPLSTSAKQRGSLKE